jgi:hypothetical protein
MNIYLIYLTPNQKREIGITKAAASVEKTV